MTEGYIYVLEDEADVCKIGVTKRDPNTRTKEISAEHKKELKLRASFDCSDIFRYEKHLLKVLKPHQIKGEWFKLSFLEICKVIESQMDFLNQQVVDRSGSFAMNLKIPLCVLKKIDESIARKPWLNRTQWIMNAIGLKLDKEAKEAKDD